MPWPQIRAAGAMQQLLDLVRDVPMRDVAPPERSQVWWAREALSVFIADAERWAPLETGAALLGYKAESAIVVIDVVLGGPRARHRHTSFLPDARWQIDRIRERFYESGRLHRYLGEVHTHPTGGCAPSRRDRRTLRRIARHPAARLPRPLMVVVAGVENEWVAGTWEYVDGAIQACDNQVVGWAELAQTTS